MLTRLTDRIEASEENGEIVIIRYGLWGITAEIERRGAGKFVVVHKNKKEKPFKRLVDAEMYLTELARTRKE